MFLSSAHSPSHKHHSPIVKQQSSQQSPQLQSSQSPQSLQSPQSPQSQSQSPKSLIAVGRYFDSTEKFYRKCINVPTFPLFPYDPRLCPRRDRMPLMPDAAPVRLIIPVYNFRAKCIGIPMHVVRFTMSIFVD